MVLKLSLKHRLDNSKFEMLALLVSIAVAAAVYFLLTRVDLVVHVQLYSFGLVFSSQWVDPYRFFMWLIYGCLLAPVVLSGVGFFSRLMKQKSKPFVESRETERKQSPICGLENSKYKLLALFVSIAIAGTIYFLLTRVDLIVHEQLYTFGLVFSTEWVDPYRFYMWSIYSCLLAPVALNGAALTSVLLKLKMHHDAALQPLKPAKPQIKIGKTQVSAPKFSEKELPRAQDFVKRISKAPEPSNEDKVMPAEDLKIEVKHEEEPQVIASPPRSLKSKDPVNMEKTSCPLCKKTFHLPLVSLDFSDGKTRLVNVCPYCSQVLRGNELETGVIIDANLVDKVVKCGDNQDRRN
jgi:hypothetical protein